jgi:hypothetical protein
MARLLKQWQIWAVAGAVLGTGFLAVHTAVAATAVRTAVRALDPFNPTLTTTSTTTITPPSDPTAPAPMLNSTLEPKAIIRNPPVRDPFRPPARSPFRP